MILVALVQEVLSAVLTTRRIREWAMLGSVGVSVGVLAILLWSSDRPLRAALELLPTLRVVQWVAWPAAFSAAAARELFAGRALGSLPWFAGLALATAFTGWLSYRLALVQARGEGASGEGASGRPSPIGLGWRGQVANVATLPGIEIASLAMPDIHTGYGFTIGGVAAFDLKEGIISPGGVGYDINCGVRLLRSNLTKQEVLPRIKDLVDVLYNEIPSGVGSKGKIRLSPEDERRVLTKGALWAVENGFGESSDIERIESRGMIDGADPSLISNKAYERGRAQQGTLGSGNHFLEIQYVDEIYDENAANSLGLFEGQMTVMIHTGSRGFGHQVCTDFLEVMERASGKYRIELYDRELACAPFQQSGGTGLSCRNARCCKLRLGKQAMYHALDKGGLHENPELISRFPRNGPDL